MRYGHLLLKGIIFGMLILGMGSACQNQEIPPQMPAQVPPGILVDRVPQDADVLFVSMRYVLGDPACLDENYRVKVSFLNDQACLEKIYHPDLDVLASPRQLYAMQISTGKVVQLTNLACDFSSVKPINPQRLMAAGMCSDTDEDGIISTKDKPEIYLVDLAENEVSCLTCGFDLKAINNPDYSQANGLFLFSAQRTEKFHNYLFTLDMDLNLVQITSSEDYMDFDCSWSEDGTKVVFSRLPLPFFDLPSQVWLMDSDGSNLQQITSGGTNPSQEEPHGPYPIGIDADPDLSPDNRQIVFSRLRTGRENVPFGVYELITVDLHSGEVKILDTGVANMIPEWKERGIILIRQIGSPDSVMDRKQRITMYQDGIFINLEPDHDTFPIGSNGASWAD